MNNNDKTSLPDVNARIIEKLDSYKPAVKEMALQAIRLSETFPEDAVAEQLQSLIRNTIRQQNGALK